MANSNPVPDDGSADREPVDYIDQPHVLTTSEGLMVLWPDDDDPVVRDFIAARLWMRVHPEAAGR